ncbi:hypothetical protein [Neomoorella thermoacetica]|uniref:hypothetical protein n=2 Tax=Neomoorella thermoacetica TaxID=1525 RepID=UPI0002EC6016|nr:hypothetical protein [Moorella thermoacetica]GLI16419.1 hypothetical protein MTHERMOG20_08730 [Moorella thermoacetica]
MKGDAFKKILQQSNYGQVPPLARRARNLDKENIKMPAGETGVKRIKGLHKEFINDRVEN